MSSTGKRAFGVLCAGALAAAAITPGWSQELARQGYYANLAMVIDEPPSVYAGETMTINAVVYAAGPDTAEQPYVIASTPWFFPTGTGGWEELSPPTWRLRLDPLAPASDRRTPLEIRVPSSHRGAFAIGMVAGSGETDPYPGDELDVVAILPKVKTQLVFDVGTAHTATEVVWRVDVTNLGPSFARYFRYSLAGADASAVSLECTPFAAACWQGTGGIEANGGLRFTLRAPMPADEGEIAAQLHVETTEPEDENRGTYIVPLSYARGALLLDGFE